MFTPEIMSNTGMILINLQRAFDTLDHKILLDKKKCISFSEKIIKLFHSHLTSRAFFVSLDNEFFGAGTINYEVLQGSILGPLLFLLYINDTPQALSGSHTYLYVNDFSVFYQHQDVGEIKNALNKIKLNVFFSVKKKNPVLAQHTICKQ